MELTEIEAFVAIVEHGTFTRAATELHISQPAISRRITLLESDLGAPVFERMRQGAVLTEAGAAFLPHAQAILGRVRDGIDAVRALDAHHTGTIDVAMVGTLASTPIVSGLRTFRERHPLVTLNITTANSPGVGALVRSGKAHLGLRYFEDRDPGITCHVIGQERLVVVKASGSRLVPEGPTSIAQLAEVPWVTFPLDRASSGEGFARLLDSSFQRHGLPLPRRVEIDSLTAQKRMVEADFGLGLLPESAIIEERQLGTLEVVATAGFVSAAPICLLTRESVHQSRALRSFVELLMMDSAFTRHAAES